LKYPLTHAVRQLNLYEVPYTLYAINDGLCHVGLTASVLLTLSITVERHSAVCSATNYQTRQAKRGRFVRRTATSRGKLENFCLGK
jgi:hypothetical protein